MSTAVSSSSVQVPFIHRASGRFAYQITSQDAKVQFISAAQWLKTDSTIVHVHVETFDQCGKKVEKSGTCEKVTSGRMRRCGTNFASLDRLIAWLTCSAYAWCLDWLQVRLIDWLADCNLMSWLLDDPLFLRDFLNSCDTYIHLLYEPYNGAKRPWNQRLQPAHLNGSNQIRRTGSWLMADLCALWPYAANFKVWSTNLPGHRDPGLLSRMTSNNPWTFFSKK